MYMNVYIYIMIFKAIIYIYTTHNIQIHRLLYMYACMYMYIYFYLC